MRRRKTFSGSLDANLLQDRIDALRERQKEGSEYALAGLRGKKRTKRPKKWKPTYRYVSADSRSHRAKDTRFNRP